MNMDNSFSFSKEEFSHSKLLSLRELKDKNSRLQKQIKQSLECIQEEYKEILSQIEVLNSKENSKRKLNIEFLKFTNPRESQSTLLYFLKNFTGDRNDLMPYEIEQSDNEREMEEDLDAQIKEFLQNNAKKTKKLNDQKKVNQKETPQLKIEGGSKRPNSGERKEVMEKEKSLESIKDKRVKDLSFNEDSFMLMNIKEENFENFEKEEISKLDSFQVNKNKYSIEDDVNILYFEELF
jgi:hypothetical protein